MSQGIYGYSELNASEWPHGLICCECNSIMVDGKGNALHAMYACRGDDMESDPPIMKIVCVDCASTDPPGSLL